MRKDRNTFFQESQQMNYSYMPNGMGMPFNMSQGNSSYFMGPDMPNNMNNNIDSRIQKIERQIHRLESRVSKLESLTNNNFTTEEIDTNNNSSMYMI